MCRFEEGIYNFTFFSYSIPWAMMVAGWQEKRWNATSNRPRSPNNNREIFFSLICHLKYVLVEYITTT